MHHYLLACPCGRKTEVEPRQAGQTIRCGCGDLLEVPTLLAMRSLPQAEPAAADALDHPTPWGLRQRMVLLGLVAVLGAAVAAASLYLARPVPPIVYPQADQLRREMQDISPLRSIQLWRALQQGLESREHPGEKAYAEARFRYHLWLGVTGLVGLAGLGLIAAAMLLAPGRS